MIEKYEKNTAEHLIDKNSPETDDIFEIINLSDLEPAVKEYVELSELEGGTVKDEDEIVELSDITLTASSENGSILELTEEYRAGAPEIETPNADGGYDDEFSLDLEKTGEEELLFEGDAFFDLIEESDEETFGDMDDLDGDDLDLIGDEGLATDLPEMSDEDISFEDKSVFELTDEFDLTEEAQMADFELDLPESEESGLEIDDDEAEIMEDDEFIIDEIEIEESDETADELSDLLNDLDEDEDEVEFDLGDMLESEAESDSEFTSDSEAASIEITEEEEFSLDEIFEEDDADVILSETEPSTGLSEVAASDTEAPTTETEAALDKSDQYVEEKVDSLESELLEKLDSYFDTEDEEEVDTTDSGQIESRIASPVAPPVESAQRDSEQTTSTQDGSENRLVISPDQLEAALDRVIEKKFGEQIDKILNDIISQKVSDEINAFKSVIVNSMKNRE